MEVTAFSKSVQVAPRKVRLVADLVRRQSIDMALLYLANLKKRGAGILEETLRSAVANAVNRNLSKEKLFIKSIDVTEGPAYKRFHPSTRGRVHPYKKRTTHIRIVLSDDQNSKSKSQNAKVKVQSSEVKKEVGNGAKD